MTSMLGKNIRRLREANNLTQAQLAEMVRQSQAEISDYERGTGEPRLVTLVQIARALNAMHLPLQWWIEDHDTASLSR